MVLWLLYHASQGAEVGKVKLWWGKKSYRTQSPSSSYQISKKKKKKITKFSAVLLWVNDDLHCYSDALIFIHWYNVYASCFICISVLSSFSCNRSYIYWNSYSNCDFHPTHSVSFCPIRSILYGPVLINSWVCALKWTLRGLLSVSWSMWGEEAFEWIRRGWVCRRAWVTECVL